MTSTNRDSSGRFGAGNKASPGRPKLTEKEIATRECLRVIDDSTPLLLANALERAERGESELMGPALTILGEILKARNLETEQRMRSKERAFAELSLGASTH
ncbi:hypothetical protein [Pseudomonas fluorescens]|uniref:Uncharacterized protein n=1 Tax=Pseudomonas fluorescens TaxID=294 RepID=A0A4Y9TA90_PSEFL|nr:hypothetical protein [Pseudomonas fluorescens]TFW40908.1 hypothetical protein E4T65_23975 [Pseudomonas fluorescens]